MKIGKTIFRSVKSRDFTTFSNALLRDETLSYKARGVLCMVLSNNDDWEVHQSWICERGTEGREAIKSAMQELEAHGHVQHEDIRKSGKIVGTRWIFHEVAIPEAERTNRTRWLQSPDYGKPQSGSPNYGKPEVGKPEVGNPSPKKDYREENNQSENNTLSLSSEPAKKHRKGNINGSRPTQEMIETFCVEIGLSKRDGEHCFHKWEGNGWTNGGKPIKNWQATIRSWKCQGDILPSQKVPRFAGNGRGMTPAPSDNPPSGLVEWVNKHHPEYLRVMAGKKYPAWPGYITSEFVAYRRGGANQLS